MLRCSLQSLRDDAEFVTPSVAVFASPEAVSLHRCSAATVRRASAATRASRASGCTGFFFFFRRDALKEQFGKEPNRVSCLAVKSALLGTRHPRKEKEAALQIKY